VNEDMGKRVNSIAAIAIVALVLLGVLAITHQTTTAQNNAGTQKTMQVSGVGTASTTPDLALLDFSVTSQATTAARASSDNSASVVDVIQALITLGYSRADFHTTSYSLQPLYNSSQGQTNAIIGYQIWNNMEVSTSNFTKIGVTIDAVVNAGVNQIQSITFTFSNTTLANLQSQALQRAVQDANTKATTIASALNVQLIGPIDVSPGFAYQPYVQAFTSNAPSTQIQPPSSLQVSVTVQITYAYT
jgi:hypothetical protein